MVSLHSDFLKISLRFLLDKSFFCCTFAVSNAKAGEFLLNVPKQAYNKIIYNIDRIARGERNAELFSKLGDSNIWEFRTLYSGIAYRLFAFWDKEEETLVVATHGIVKKSQRTPLKEIAKAENIRKIYFEDKQKHK